MLLWLCGCFTHICIYTYFIYIYICNKIHYISLAMIFISEFRLLSSNTFFYLFLLCFESLKCEFIRSCVIFSYHALSSAAAIIVFTLYIVSINSFLLAIYKDDENDALNFELDLDLYKFFFHLLGCFFVFGFCFFFVVYLYTFFCFC